MHRRRDDGPISVQPRALYPIVVLARAANVDTRLLRRLLRSSGVALVRAGRTLLVPLAEIEERIPPLWRSIRALERIRADASEPPESGRPGRPDTGRTRTPQG